ncbi:MAG: SsrA-binding protein SmpB [Bacilli bacterium]
MEITNKSARYNYEILDSIECGIVLMGSEIKSVRKNGATIKDSYGIIRNNELYLLNCHISKYDKADFYTHEELRIRKLLLHKNEIKKLKNQKTFNNITFIPLKMYFKNGKLKLLLGLGKGKKNYDKRESIKKRDIERNIKNETYKN